MHTPRRIHAHVYCNLTYMHQKHWQAPLAPYLQCIVIPGHCQVIPVDQMNYMRNDGISCIQGRFRHPACLWVVGCVFVGVFVGEDKVCEQVASVRTMIMNHAVSNTLCKSPLVHSSSTHPHTSTLLHTVQNPSMSDIYPLSPPHIHSKIQICQTYIISLLDTQQVARVGVCMEESVF